MKVIKESFEVGIGWEDSFELILKFVISIDYRVVIKSFNDRLV